MAIPERYNKGYNIGVGGAVVRDGRLLLVRRASRRGHGNWQVPGGFIEPQETIEEAVVREVAEEAGVKAEVEGVLGVRSRVDVDSGNSIYVVLLLRGLEGEPKPDDHEVDRAGYFSLTEIRRLTPLPPTNWEIAKSALTPGQRLLGPKSVSNLRGATFTLFVDRGEE
jgi:ADP-ribose pyrophosphatase YjhB (NUDIX family)